MYKPRKGNNAAYHRQLRRRLKANLRCPNCHDKLSDEDLDGDFVVCATCRADAQARKRAMRAHYLQMRGALLQLQSEIRRLHKVGFEVSVSAVLSDLMTAAATAVVVGLEDVPKPRVKVNSNEQSV